MRSHQLDILLHNVLVLLGWLTAFCSVAQEVPSDPVQTYAVDDPTNWDCANAVRFCSDLTFSFSNSDHGDGCLYFYFYLPASTSVNVGAVGGTGDKVKFFFVSTSLADMCNPRAEGPSCPLTNASSVANYAQVVGPGVVFLVWDPANEQQGGLNVDVKESLPPCDPLPCEDCLRSFNPETDKRYVISAWCMMLDQPQDVSTYNDPNGPFLDVYVNSAVVLNIRPSGPIIDGWQRIEEAFYLPGTAGDLKLELGCGEGEVLFDDVRFFPSDGSMKCIVHDPITLRLDAELDERHFATMYEYDGEGRLTRIKKETERGIMTIQETRYNAPKP